MSARDAAAGARPATRALGLGVAEALRPDGAEWSAVQDLQALQALPDAAFDLLIVGDAQALGARPAAALAELARLAAPGATLLLQHDHSARFQSVERIALGDRMPAHDGDAACGAAALSVAGLYMLLLDAGWMPHLQGQLPLQPEHQAAAAALCAVAQAQGMPPASARRTLAVGGVIVQARRLFDAAPRGTGRARFSVVVPVTRESQYESNIVPSPGLAEVGAEVVRCTGATSPADALARALPQCSGDWILLAHQDVYFPRGFGHRLNALLGAVAPERRADTLIGFAGIGVDESSRSYRPAGFVIDRQSRFDHAASQAAVSIDEFALVLARDSVHRIDPAIGWHLWATDLCLAAICEHKVFPRIERLPLFHNSWNDYVLPQAFQESAATLLRKYPDFGPIHTLCGVIDASWVARQQRAA
jgi:hypothetical protein